MARSAKTQGLESYAKNPLTPKGKKILASMQQQYGKKKGEQVFYASANKGVVKGVHNPLSGTNKAVLAGGVLMGGGLIYYYMTKKNAGTVTTPVTTSNSSGGSPQDPGTSVTG